MGKDTSFTSPQAVFLLLYYQSCSRSVTRLYLLPLASLGMLSPPPVAVNVLFSVYS